MSERTDDYWTTLTASIRAARHSIRLRKRIAPDMFQEWQRLENAKAKVESARAELKAARAAWNALGADK